MFQKIYDILVSFLGESKQGGYDQTKAQYQFPCPKCIEERGINEKYKYNLEVNLKSQVFQCWSCSNYDDSMKGKLSKLIKKYGGKEAYTEYKEEMASLINSKLYSLDELQGRTLLDNDVIIELPKSYTKIPNLELCDNYYVKSYLKKRKITQDIIDRFNIGYTTWDDPDYHCRNRIVIPSYDEFGDLNYWSLRDFTGKAKSKYKNCSTEKNDIIFQESLIDFDSDIILCEGTIDAIYIPNCISLLGKTLRKQSKLCKDLKSKCRGNIIICLDSDTTIVETKKIYTTLNVGSLKGRVFYLRMEKYKDFGEMFEYGGKTAFLNEIKKIRRFKEIDLVLY